MRCSFCNLVGHNITCCPSPEIPVLYRRIKDIHYESRAHYLWNDNLAKRYFTSRVMVFQLKELRVVAVKYEIAYASHNKSKFVSELWEHFDYRLVNNLDNDNLFDEMQHNFVRRENEMMIEMMGYYENEEEIIENDDLFDQLITKKYDICITLDESLSLNTVATTECAICFENIHCNGLKINCNHVFCGNCIRKTLVSCNTLSPLCALCREPMKTFDVQNKDTFELVKINCTKRRRIIVEDIN